ncbi:MAG: UDP-N-acetylmuramoyl-L-alanyl-D-glutamate--2,6-diaminopimelate ligase, partial [Acidimicrobiia bacterium]
MDDGRRPPSLFQVLVGARERATTLAGATILGDGDVLVSDITHDSRQVRAGTVFCAVRGAVADGHRFAPDAVRSGASALVVDRQLDLPVPQVVVSDVRAAMGPLAASLFGDPSASLHVVAVTGTNGKTTTCHLLRAIFEANGWPSGIIGTLSGARTTPEAPDLQRELARLHDGGAVAVAMEATSIGLEMHRMDGMSVEVAVFTNLSRDHLDVHHTMGRYFAAKARLFEPSMSKRSVVNFDDPYGRLLADAAQIPTTGFAIADVEIEHSDPLSSRFRWRGHLIELPIGGRFNIMNALGAAAAASELGIDDAVIAAGLADAPAVPGRFEPIVEGQRFTVLVDYAHTPDGLAVALDAVRPLVGDRRIIVVFGAGGDRDQSKRPLMGDAVARRADVAVVTTDNPRHEDPGAIISDVVSGIDPSSRARVLVEPDRRAAITSAMEMAEPGDVVLIAGRGHER